MTLPDTLFLGKHAFAVLASFGFGVAALGGLILQSLRAARRSRLALAAAEGGRHG